MVSIGTKAPLKRKWSSALDVALFFCASEALKRMSTFSRGTGITFMLEFKSIRLNPVPLKTPVSL